MCWSAVDVKRFASFWVCRCYVGVDIGDVVRWRCSDVAISFQCVLLGGSGDVLQVFMVVIRVCVAV